jgi:hypothetical protein
MSLPVLAQNIALRGLTPENKGQIKGLPEDQRKVLANLVKSKLDDDYLKITIPPQIINPTGGRKTNKRRKSRRRKTIRSK